MWQFSFAPFLDFSLKFPVSRLSENSLTHFQADRERAARQREYLSQLEEVTIVATTSTMEGEHTLSPGAGEEGGEGLGEVSFLLNSCRAKPRFQFCQVRPAQWVLLFHHSDLKAYTKCLKQRSTHPPPFAPPAQPIPRWRRSLSLKRT